MYNFNFNVLDPYIVRPVMSPGVIMFRNRRVMMSNFTGNLEEPAVMVTLLL